MKWIKNSIYNAISMSRFSDDGFIFPRLIHLIDSNPYFAKEACKNAIGFNSIIAKNKVLELIKGEYPEGKVDFFPNTLDIVYLRNPYVKNIYISLNLYFEYIKKHV